MKLSFFKNKPLLFLILLCLPLLFINVKDSHDWGDDFAQYFLQARNIIEHRPQTDNGLVFDQQEAQYQSNLKAYPVGFPLMLASVWKVHEYSIKAFSILISILMIGFAALTFLYLKKTLSPLLSFVLVLAVIYNPVMLDFKKEVLSDIPFSFFMLLAILFFQIESKKTWQGILTGILFGWAMSVRGIGVALFIALAIWVIVSAFSKNKVHQAKQHPGSLTTLLSGIVFYLLLNSFLFPISTNSFFGFYAQAFKEERVMDMIKENLNYYYNVLQYFFGQGDGILQRVSKVTKYFMIYGFLFGMVVSWKRKFAFDDLVFILYAAIILVYPYQAGGFRFLIPLIPFMLKYAGIGIKTGFEMIRLPKAGLLTTMIMVIVLFQNIDGMRAIIRNQNTIERGPQSSSAENMLSFVKNNLPGTAVIAFAKPRALSFYTDKKAACFSRKITVEQIHKAMERMKAHYFLVKTVDPELNDPKLKEYVSFYKNDLRVAWKNEEFTIYTDHKDSLNL